MAINGRPAVNVARPSLLGNPFIVVLDGTRIECRRFYALYFSLVVLRPIRESLPPIANDDVFRKPRHRQLVENAPRDRMVAAMRDLVGKNLACWCQLDAPCHADFLLNLPSLKER